MGSLKPPEPLTQKHKLDGFKCGQATLDEWLKRRAFKNELAGASRTFVVCDENQQVIGYYTLATGAVARGDTPGSVRRNMPDPIPVMVLGRLAVDSQHQSKNIGRGLLIDAIRRTLIVSRHAGVRALLVHALSEEAKAWYLKCGFRDSPLRPMTLMLPLSEIEMTEHSEV